MLNSLLNRSFNPLSFYLVQCCIFVTKSWTSPPSTDELNSLLKRSFKVSGTMGKAEEVKRKSISEQLCLHPQCANSSISSLSMKKAKFLKCPPLNRITLDQHKPYDPINRRMDFNAFFSFGIINFV